MPTPSPIAHSLVCPKAVLQHRRAPGPRARGPSLRRIPPDAPNLTSAGGQDSPQTAVRALKVRPALLVTLVKGWDFARLGPNHRSTLTASTRTVGQPPTPLLLPLNNPSHHNWSCNEFTCVTGSTPWKQPTRYLPVMKAARDPHSIDASVGPPAVHAQ